MATEPQFRRWWIYQRERFPILAHGPLIAAFSFSAVSYSALLRAQQILLAPTTLSVPPERAIVAFASAFLFFLQLRIADEWKDFEEDARHRPYRPVPRGLVTLRELAILGVAAALMQLALALWLQPALALLLAGVWLYLGLMSREFFIRRWLKLHPLTYLWTHMLIIPLIDGYATACDWLAAGHAPPRGLEWFLLVSFCNGTVLEIGRKIRAPQDEEAGVETYSVLWGRGGAVAAWLAALVLTAACAAMAAREIGFLAPLGGLLFVMLLLAGIVAARFLQQPQSRRAKMFDAMSALWTLLMYLGLGAVPLALRARGALP